MVPIRKTHLSPMGEPERLRSSHTATVPNEPQMWGLQRFHCLKAHVCLLPGGILGQDTTEGGKSHPGAAGQEQHGSGVISAQSCYCRGASRAAELLEKQMAPG